jgi:hypothetical protein
MRRHLKSRFQMLRHKRLNEVNATDTYFSSIFYKVYRRFLLCGIPSALRRDNAKSEKSQKIRQIHRDLVIADQHT